VVKTTENSNGLDGGTFAELLGRHRNWYSLTNPLKRSCVVEIVSGMDLQHIRKTASSEDDDVIEALTTNAAKIALARCIHKRGPALPFARFSFQHPSSAQSPIWENGGA